MRREGQQQSHFIHTNHTVQQSEGWEGRHALLRIRDFLTCIVDHTFIIFTRDCGDPAPDVGHGGVTAQVLPPHRGALHRPVPRSHPHRQMRLRATQFAQWPLEWPARRVPALRAAVANGHSAAAGTAAKNIAPLAGSRALRTTACGAAGRPRRRMLAAAAAAAGAVASCSLLASGSAVVHLAADDTASRPARLPVWPEDSRERWAYPSPYDAEAPEGPPRERFKGNEDFFDRR